MLRAVAVRALCAAAFLTIGWCGDRAIAGDVYVQPAYRHGPIHPVASIPRSAVTGWSNDPLVALGQRLFFDTRLSGTGAKACASCHNPGYSYAEPRWVSIADNGKLGRRNAPALVDVGYLPRLMWDGSFNTLEQQAFGPFQRGEMGIGIEHAAQRVNADPQYVHLFRSAFGGWATPDSMARALAAYQRTLVSPVSRVDRFLTRNEPGILSPLERDGYSVFTRRAACSNCHHVFPIMGDGRPSSRPLYTDLQFHNLGIGYRGGVFADAGRYELSRHPAEWGAFRTPSLRHSARTAPYMHDGSFATLEEVVEFYNAGARPNPNISPLIRPLGLSDYEKSSLVAFLRALGN